MKKIHVGAFSPWYPPLPFCLSGTKWFDYGCLIFREKWKKGTFLAWKRSRLEVNYEQRQILLSFPWVRKIKATLIPGLSPQPPNSWEWYQLICLCFVVSPSLALQIKDTTSTFRRKAWSLHHVPTMWKKNVASFSLLFPRGLKPPSQQLQPGSSSAASSSQALAGDKRWNSLQLSRNKCNQGAKIRDQGWEGWRMGQERTSLRRYFWI